MAEADEKTEETTEENQEGSTESTESKSADSDKTLTQADMDRIVAERLGRERAKDRAKYADYADLKAKAAEHDKIVESQRSEQEKAVEAARKEGADSVLTKANERLIVSEARALAAEANFRSPAFVVRALDLSDVTVSQDGTVDAAALKAALKVLAADQPYLVDDGKPRTPKPDFTQGSGRGGSSSGGEKGLAEAERRFGKKTTRNNDRDAVS